MLGLDRSQGDTHAAGNPHFLIDPANAKIVAAHLARAFAALDAAGARGLRRRPGARFDGGARRQDGGVDGRPGALRRPPAGHLPSRPGVISASASACAPNTFLEPKPGIPPSPPHLAAVIQKMQNEKITVLLVEPYQPRKTAESVAETASAVVVDVCQFPGGLPDTPSYLELIDSVVQRIAAGAGRHPRLGERPMELFTLWLWPLVALIGLPAILVYFGLHVVGRGIIFVDLALAQIAALGIATAVLLGADPEHSVLPFVLAIAFTLAGAASFR